MIHTVRALLLVVPLLLATALWSGCHRESADSAEEDDSPSAPAQGQYTGPDPIRAEIDAFRYQIRGYYNNRNFPALEKSMAEIRSGPPLFANGSWKLNLFYDSLGCSSKEPESMWQLHDRIHKEWIAAFPKSITAHVAYADYLVDYAWHARTNAYADKVTPEGWRLMGERLAAAQQVLTASKTFTPQCPHWWHVEMNVALGQEWTHADYGRLYSEAKQVAPQYFYYDQSLANYLLPRWYGQPGDWEKAAAAEMKRPQGLGAEGYARVVLSLRGYYDNIFQETKASWPDTRAGMEMLRQKYPQSREILIVYCKLAFLAKDQPVAKSLVPLLKDFDKESWKSQQEFNDFQTWARGQGG